MPLKVKKDGVTIPKSLGRVVDSSGNEFHEHESYIYAEGDIVQDEDVSPTFLQKLEDGNFGDCERCGEAIAEKRLEALPFARYCIECQRAIEEEERTAAG